MRGTEICTVVRRQSQRLSELRQPEDISKVLVTRCVTYVASN